MLGRGSRRADTQTTLLGTVGDTQEEGAGESRFFFLLVSSKPRWRSLGKAIGLWALVLLSSAHHRNYQWPWHVRGHFVMDGDNGGQGCGQDGPPGFSFGLSQFPVIRPHSCNWCPD